MTAFPKCLVKLEDEVRSPAQLPQLQSYRVECSGTVRQAHIEVTDVGVIFIFQHRFRLEEAAQLLPEYSLEGALLAIGL